MTDAAGSAAGQATVEGIGAGVVESAGTAAGQASAAAVGLLEVPNPSGQSVDESVDSQNPLANALKAGLENIDQNASVRFVKYVKLVMPLDGMVFWIKASLVNESALLNGSPMNTWTANQSKAVIALPQDFVAPGSLHFTTTNTQDPDESFSVNSVVFTSEVKVNDLNEIMPDTMYIAEISDFKFAFSKREMFYKQADLYHYRGDAVYPVMENLIIDNAAQLAPSLQIVSNSLPIWLRLNDIMPMYPSFLSPDNIRPPFATIHIGEEDTEALQSFPYIDQTRSHWQLAKDRVKITMYGLNNEAALRFQDYVLRKSLELGTFGLMAPDAIVRDVKRGQVELSVIAMKKSMIYTISYYQSVARDEARQLILEAIPSFIVAD